MKKGVLSVSVFLMAAVVSVSATAAEIRVPDVKGSPEKGLEVPIIVSKVDSLAALKMVVWYDHDVLTYVGLSKGPAAKSLLHAVNDRTPGILVISMAGARGVKGDNLQVFSLLFQVSLQNEHRGAPLQFMIRESRLIDENLKEVRHTVRVGKCRISCD